MPADIFASLQTLIQPQTHQNQTINTQPQAESTKTLPGLFASMIAGLTETETEAVVGMPLEGQVLTMPKPEQETPADTPAFTRSNIFGGAVLDVIAGTEIQETETLNVQPELPEVPVDDDVVIWPEDEQLDTQNPDSVKQTVVDNVSDVVRENFADVKLSDEAGTQPHNAETLTQDRTEIIDIAPENLPKDNDVVIGMEDELVNIAEHKTLEPEHVKQTLSRIVNNVKDVAYENFADVKLSDEAGTPPTGQVFTPEQVQETPAETPAFTRSNVFGGAVLDVIAGTETQNAETLNVQPELPKVPVNDDVVIWPEDESVNTPAPEPVKQTVSRNMDNVSEVVHEEFSDAVLTDESLTQVEDQLPTMPEQARTQETPSFTRSNIFGGAVLDVIAGTKPQNTETLDIAPENLPEHKQLDTQNPAPVKQTVSRNMDNVSEVVHEEFSDAALTDESLTQPEDQLPTMPEQAQTQETPSFTRSNVFGDAVRDVIAGTKPQNTENLDIATENLPKHKQLDISNPEPLNRITDNVSEVVHEEFSDAALTDELLTQPEDQLPTMPEQAQETPANTPAFTRSNVFSGAVLDVIASTKPQNADTLTLDGTETLDVVSEKLPEIPKDNDVVIWPEDEQLDTQNPAPVKQTVSRNVDNVSEVAHEEFADSGISGEAGTPPEAQLLTSEQTQEIPTEMPTFTSSNIFGGAVRNVIGGAEIVEDNDVVTWPNNEPVNVVDSEPIKQTFSRIVDNVRKVVQEEFSDAGISGEAGTPPKGQVLAPEQETPTDIQAFTRSNVFASAMRDVIGGTEIVEDNDVVTWPNDEPVNVVDSESVKQTLSRIVDKVKTVVHENFADTEISDEDAQAIAEQIIPDEGLDELPEQLKQEFAQALSDTVSTIKHEGRAESQPVVKILDSLVEQVSSPKAEAKPAKLDEPEASAETPEFAAQIAGLSAVVNTQPQAVQSDSQPQAKLDVLDAPAKHNTPQPRQVPKVEAESTAPQESPDAPESPKTPQTFRETLENRNTEQDSSAQEQTQSQNQKHSQDFGQPGGRNTPSRSRTDSRRVDTRNQPERADTSTTTHRTESRTSFQSYFTGVLSTRRSSAGTSPLPLSLRGTANFTQAAAMRDGIVNVVRFIRADGVQKANIVVDPPAIGRISVELTSGTSGVEASIKVASEQIRQLVQEQISQLRMNLSEQGVQVAEFTVDVQQDNSGQHNPNGQNQEQGHVNFIGSSEDDEPEEFRIDLEEGLLWWVA